MFPPPPAGQPLSRQMAPTPVQLSFGMSASCHATHASYSYFSSIRASYICGLTNLLANLTLLGRVGGRALSVYAPSSVISVHSARLGPPFPESSAHAPGRLWFRWRAGRFRALLAQQVRTHATLLFSAPSTGQSLVTHLVTASDFRERSRRARCRKGGLLVRPITFVASEAPKTTWFNLR